MNREKIIDAILKKVTDEGSIEVCLGSVLRSLSDTNLISYAMSMDIDTDKIINGGY